MSSEKAQDSHRYNKLFTTLSAIAKINCAGKCTYMRGFINQFLAAVATPMIENNNGETLLHWAADQGHEGYVKTLLDLKFNPNAVDHFKTTPLHSAVFGMEKAKRAPIIKRLLAAGANPYLPNLNGDSPVSYAAAIRAEDLIRTLMQTVPVARQI